MSRRRGGKRPESPKPGGAAEEPSLFEQAGNPPAPPPPAPKPPDDRHGHRERLRHRFMSGGAGAVSDYELLELILFRAIPRRDVKPIAKAILARFGDLASAIAAEPEQLREIPGLGEAAVVELKIVEAASSKLAETRLRERPLLSSWDAVVAYCRTVMARRGEEQFRVLFLDTKNFLIADELMGAGTIDQAPVYPRQVVKRALSLNAASMILVHNHPSGDPTPSPADIDTTKRLIAAAAALGIAIHDHVIIGADGEESLRSLGLM